MKAASFITVVPFVVKLPLGLYVPVVLASWSLLVDSEQAIISIWTSILNLERAKPRQSVHS